MCQQTYKKHYIAPYLLNPTHPITINLIGCGGTGSLILSRLARLDAALKQLDHPGIHLHAFDGDIVEAHNIGRQNFTPIDISKNKAMCLVEKVNLCFGLFWDASNHMLDPCQVPPANITITAVDDAEFRMKIDAHFKKQSPINNQLYNPLYWIDTGNGKDFGQVVLSSINPIIQPQNPAEILQESLKSVVDIFGDMNQYNQSQTQGIESCSFAESILLQDLFINDAIALATTTLLWKLFTNLSIEHQAILINQNTFRNQPLKIK